MSNRFDDRLPTALEVQACTEAECLFAEYLKLFPVSRKAVELLEQNLLKLALAAKMAAAKPAGNIIQADAGVAWQRDVDLMDNIYLCHRPLAGATEYAVVEHFPANGTNEIWNRGGDAAQVLEFFAKEQRQALEFGTKDMVAQTVEFLAAKYYGQDLSCLTDSLNHQLRHRTSPPQDQNYEQNRVVEMMPAA